MICVFVGKDKTVFSNLEQALIRNHLEIKWVDTGKKLLPLLADQSADTPVGLVIIDGTLPGVTARDLVEQVVMENPMVNCVATSALSPEEFHETFEGLGVLMQLPLKPDEKDAQKLVAHLNKIMGMTAIPGAGKENSDK
ncbi:MAG: hypothetical protein KKC20_09035 [Proteobacteria bacterium]|nr:hypothetical protein [Pseudomonadota bacterium]